MGPDQQERNRLADMLGRAAAGQINKEVVGGIASVLRRSLKVSRRGVTVSGHGLADLLVFTAPRIPIRSRAQLEEQFAGMNGAALAGHLIRNASRSSGMVGGATGALASAQALAMPFWVLLPAEILTETLLIAVVEMRMVAELHEVYGYPIVGDSSTRGVAILAAWSERRGVPVERLSSPEGLAQALGRNTRGQIMHVVKRRIMVRAARNITTLAPLFVGAVAAAEINRRATRDLGDSVVRDLAGRR